MSDQPETEEERLRRETREMYEELAAKGLIEGSYEEWLADATRKAIARIDPPRIVLPESGETRQ